MATSKSLRAPSVVVVGCGDWGKNIVRTLSSLGALGGIVEHQKEKGERYAQEYGVPLLSFEEALGREEVQGIVLATALSSHKVLAEATICSGKSVFIEKPVVSTVQDFEDLVLQATQRGVCLMGGHLLLYHPVFQEACRLVEGGAIGRLRLVTSHRQNFGKFFPQEDVVWDFGPHDLSLMCAILNAQNHSLNKVEVSQTPLLSANGQRDVASITLKVSPGCMGYAYLSRVSCIKEQRLSIWGTKGVLDFDDTKAWDEKLKMTPFREGSGEDHPLREKSSYIVLPHGEPLKEEMRAFLEGIKGTDMTLNHQNIKQVLGILQKI